MKKKLTFDTTEIQRLKRFLQATICQFLERYNLPRLKYKGIEEMNKPITSTEIETLT